MYAGSASPIGRIWTIWAPRKLIWSNVYKSKVSGMGKSDSLEHLPDVHEHQGEAEWLGQLPEGLEHLDTQETDVEQCLLK